MDQKHQQNKYHANANINSTAKNVIQIKSGITNPWNPTACTCENGKYLGSTIGDSVITCDEIIEAAKTI